MASNPNGMNLYTKSVLAVLIGVLLNPFFGHVRLEAGGPDRDRAGSFIFTDVKGNAQKPLTVWYYHPSGFGADSPIVFVMHGMKRNAEHYRDRWATYAQQHGFFLVVPEFSQSLYEGQTYNFGNMATKDGKFVSEDRWGFSVIEHLFDYIREATNNHSSRYFIYGHSAGGQFVHRMVLFKTDARIRTAIAANPGVYALPSFAAKFPYGLGGSGMTLEQLKMALGKDFVLLIGEKDSDEKDPHLSKVSEAMAQGKDRLERAHHFSYVAGQQATELGVEFKWRFQTVPGATHRDSQMAAAAMQLLFGEDRP